MARTVLLIFQAPTQRRLFINTLPPLGILGIASYLTSKGLDVTVRDCYTDMLRDEDILRADLIGLSINVSNVENSLNTIARISRAWPEKRIVVGGPLPMSAPEQIIRQEGIRAVAIGEGEEIMHQLATEESWDAIKGLYLKDDTGRIFFTGAREPIRNLDLLPFPALDRVDLSRYYSPVKKALPISNIMTSRGCPFNCIFCFKTMGSAWRARSVKNVVDEIEWQVHAFGVREICIYDDNFSMDVERAEAICDEIIERKIKVHLQLPNGIRVDRLTRAALRKLKAAGVWLVGVAPETGSRETLKKISKGFDLDKVSDVVRWCKEEGISTYSFFMIGFPWEEKTHIEDTIRFATGLDTELTQFSRVTAFPGTALYDILLREGAIRGTALRDQGLFYGGTSHMVKGISDAELRRLITRAYRRAYLRPGKWLRLLRMLSLRDLWNLFVYSLTTGSI
ncbi:MAG: radical SAM protein [Candidatus Aureabacteria bacterium]|nr:radical SAM protein [Candidatus Auribacterota bacterium]